MKIKKLMQNRFSCSISWNGNNTSCSEIKLREQLRDNLVSEKQVKVILISDTDLTKTPNEVQKLVLYILSSKVLQRTRRKWNFE